MKGQKYIAALISTIEITVYVFGLNLVLQYLNHVASITVYAAGYGLGILTGSWIEEKLALGYITLKVICNKADGKMESVLRSKGYGVTAWIGSGRDGDRLVMEILAKRKNQAQLYHTILSLDPKHSSLHSNPSISTGDFGQVSLKDNLEY